MDRMVYTAMAGAMQSQDRQAVVSNNLANVSTDGFKAKLNLARAVPVNGPGWQTRASTVETTPADDLSPGPIQATGRTLDVAIKGQGWIAVLDDDGTESYTRNGALKMDATGVLRSQGKPVLAANGRPVVLPLNATVTIAEDGTISAIEGDDLPDAINEVGQIKLVNPNAQNLVRGGDGAFRLRVPEGQDAAEPLPVDETVRIASGALEGSNVSPTKAMVAMIDNARHYEMQMKAISTADDNARRANNLLSI